MTDPGAEAGHARRRARRSAAWRHHPDRGGSAAAFIAALAAIDHGTDAGQPGLIVRHPRQARLRRRLYQWRRRRRARRYITL